VSETAATNARRAPIRVLIADDHALYSEALAAILTADERIEVVGSATDGAEAVDLAKALRPDIVLMDIHMPVLDGIEATREICRALPGMRVVVVTSSTAAEMVARARGAGAVGYLTKDCSARDLVSALVGVAGTSAPATAAPLWSPAY
jgi:DNA-binding NarL/FixJ family response regulator